MSMLDSFFNKGFKAAKCKTLLKMTIPRIKLLRNRREIQLKKMRHDIAKLLETGQEATARIRVEHIMREEKMMAAQEILELYCELISVRLPIIEAQRECPLDLKEAISSVCFAAPRCADLPELQQAQMMFAGKYGREFISAATELMPDCGVNRQIIELLSIRAPPAEDKLKLLKEIAEEHELEWDPAASEAELFKSHDDLLNGSAVFISGAKLQLPKEKLDESLHSAHEQSNYEKADTEEDDDYDSYFPEVSKASVIHASAPQMLPLSPSASQNHPEDQEFPQIKETLSRSGPEEEEKEDQDQQVMDTTKQFLPFISPPTFPSSSFSIEDEDPKEISPESPPISKTRSEASVDLQDVISPESPPLSRKRIEASVDLQGVEDVISPESPPLSRKRIEASVDLQGVKDVIAAANAAAESAELAAAAARSAASMAQLRMNELNLKNDTTDANPFATEPVDECPSDSPSPPKHQPERLPSMNDDPYLTYPSLFSPQNSTNGTNSHLFNEARFDKGA